MILGIKTPEKSGQADKSVRVFDGMDTMIPMLKHGVNPTCIFKPLHSRDNPPIHRWDTSGPIPRNNNRFNGLKDKG